METGVSMNHSWVILEPAAALGLHLFQLIQRGEDPIGQRLIGERPKPLSRLEFGRIRWEKQQVDSLGKRNLGTLVPTGPIQDQHDLFVRSRSGLLGKQREGLGEDLPIHRWQQEPARLPALWMDKGKDIHPFIALGHWSSDGGSFGCPDPPQNGLEANAVLIHTPQFNTCVRMGLLDGLDLFGQVFLKAC